MSNPHEQHSSRSENIIIASVSGAIGTVAGAILIAAGTQAFTALQKLPVWIPWALTAVVILALVVGIPRSRRRVKQFLLGLWSLRPVTHRRLARARAAAQQQVAAATSREVQATTRNRELLNEVTRADHQATVRDADHDRQVQELQRQVELLTDTVQRAQAEKRAAEGTFEREKDALRRLHEQDMRDVEAKNSEKLKHTLELGTQLGESMHRYGEDWPNLSPMQRGARMREVHSREAEQQELPALVAELQGRLATTNDKYKTALREQFEAGRRQGLEEAEQALETVDEANIIDGNAPGAPRRTPKPRWRLGREEDPYGSWLLTNFVPRSIAREVRLESDESEFLINDAADWAQVDGSETAGTTVAFEGEWTPHGREVGTRFELYWTNSNGDVHVDYLTLLAPNPRIVDPWDPDS